MNKLNKSKSKNFIGKLVAALALSFGFTLITQTTNSQSTTHTVQAAKTLSKAERAAKNWIAMKESGGNYNARNGVCYGKYQLNINYLRGDYSKSNQEKVADNYVYGRYGSWVNAKNFWLSHHWY